MVNALSARLVAEEHPGGTAVRHRYARGERTTPPTGTGPSERTATTITFHPDPELLTDTDFQYPALAAHLDELALLNRELDFTLTDERTTPPRVGRFHHPGGPADFTTRLGGDHAATLTAAAEDERMGGTVDLALSWSGRGGIRCYANSRRTSGGTHLEGFHDGLRAALLPHPGEHALRAALAELTAVVSVKLDDPHYEGSTHETLGNHPVRARVAETVRRAVEAWLVEHPRTFG